jgi:hypothetical protein
VARRNGVSGIAGGQNNGLPVVRNKVGGISGGQK